VTDARAKNALLMLASAAAAAAAGWLALRFVPAEGLAAIARFQGLGLAPTVAYIGTLIWKVHDAKKAEGLSGRQQRRLMKTARLIVLRLTILTVLAILAGVFGLLANAFDPATRAWAWVIWASISAVVFVIVTGVPYAVWLKLDLMRFEDHARTRQRELQQRESILKRLGDRTTP
jgi:MFS family permease